MSSARRGGGPVVAAAGVLDQRGVAGLDGTGRRRFAARDGTALTDGAFRELFGADHPAWRRLDALGRAVAVTAEAAGLEAALRGVDPDDAGALLATRFGSLDSDCRFQRSLEGDAFVAAALFPYTLPSTALAETLIRFRVRGPTLTLALEEFDERSALLEAERLVLQELEPEREEEQERGQRQRRAAATLLFLGDVVGEAAGARCGVVPAASMACLLLRPAAAPGGGAETLPWADLIASPSPARWARDRLFAELA